jgi:hypothetical protein
VKEAVKPLLVVQLAEICLPRYDEWKSPSPLSRDKRPSITFAPLMKILTLVKSNNSPLICHGASVEPEGRYPWLGATVVQATSARTANRTTKFFLISPLKFKLTKSGSDSNSQSAQLESRLYVISIRVSVNPCAPSSSPPLSSQPFSPSPSTPEWAIWAQRCWMIFSLLSWPRS